LRASATLAVQATMTSATMLTHVILLIITDPFPDWRVSGQIIITWNSPRDHISIRMYSASL
jgi:hypothetical protein